MMQLPVALVLSPSWLNECEVKVPVHIPKLVHLTTAQKEFYTEGSERDNVVWLSSYVY
jgi:hypothetical protein